MAGLSLLCTLVLCVMLTPFNGLASGPVHGAKAAAMGTAFAAVADDPSAMASNPAGLGFQPGTRVYSGVTCVYPETRYTAPDGRSEDTEKQVFFPPFMYLSSDFGSDDVVFGLGLFSPFGIGGRKWSESGPTRYISTENLAATFEVNPTVAVHPLPSLSIAVGAVYLTAYNRVEQMVNQSAVGAVDGKTKYEADGDGWGWNAGVLWKVVPGLQAGASFRSAVDVHLSGDLNLKRIAPAVQPLFGGEKFSSQATTDMDFPPVATAGLSWMPLNGWTLLAEVEWVGWSDFDNQKIKVKDKVPAAGFGDIKVAMNWKDNWIFKVGTEYQATENLALRTGYCYQTSPVPESTLSPAMPDAPQHYLSLGFGYAWSRYVLDVFYGTSLYASRHVENQILSGTYHNTCQYLGFGLGIKF